MLDTELVDEVESGRGKVWALPARHPPTRGGSTSCSGISLPAMAKEGLAMRKSLGLTWTQTLMAANAPMLTKAALVDGKVESGVLPSGQVVGVIDDLPTCKELIDRIIAEADKVLENLEGTQWLSRGCSTASTASRRPWASTSATATGSRSPRSG